MCDLFRSREIWAHGRNGGFVTPLDTHEPRAEGEPIPELMDAFVQVSAVRRGLQDAWDEADRPGLDAQLDTQ